MNRTAQLEKRFNDILRGRVPADAQSYALFLEAICTQQDPAACINKIAESAHGSSAVQAAMRHNTNSQFLNGTATTLLTYLFRATDLGEVLDQLLVAIVDPPIFWTAFSQAFDQGELNEPAQEAFAVLLLRLMCLTTGNTSSYRDFAKKPSTLRRLLDSSQQTVKDIGYRIQHILSTLESGTPVAAVGRPGGRHDNDFNDFKEISILPTADEILCQQPPFIRPSSVLEDPDGEATRIVDYLGAAIFAQDIRAANLDVVLVEEAGEILESHVLTILGQNTSQMILIGDHKQLRPNYKLTVEKGDGFELDRSLFERLVLEGFPRETLTVQHRMRPEISAFIKKLTSTYPDLTDAPKTRGRDDIRGVRNNIIFIDHTHLEDNDSRISDKDDEASSGLKQNTYEVEMIWKIVRYLAQQGYGTERLVVLTPYLGQLSKLQDAMKRDNDPVLNDLDSHDLIRAGLMSPAEKTSKNRIRLATIDDYQGEESDIVIASLTRSNESNDIGFMNSPEHLNVLISRARDGLILIGNSQTFINARRDKELWGKFFELVKQGNYMYEGFPIKCERHPHRTVLIKSASEFDILCPNSGCTEICDIMLNCGVHPCPLKCHQISDHSQMPCQHPCSGTCPVNHELKWKCHQSKPDPCPVCVKEAERAEGKRKRELELELKQKQLDAIADAKERGGVLKQKIKDIDPAGAKAQKAATRLSLSFRTTNLVPPTPPSNPRSNAPPSNRTPSSPPPKLQLKIKPLTTQTPDSKHSKSQQLRPSSTSLMKAAPKLAVHQDSLHQKQVDGEKHSVVDGMMELTGLEDVKSASKQLTRQRESARIQQLEAKAAREKALAELKKKREERKREEAQVQRNLQQMGVCSVGYRWIKQPQGYRCAGGTHFISNDQLMRQQEKKKQEEEARKREEAQVQQNLQQMGVCSVGYRWIKQPQGYRCAGGGHFISNDQLIRQQEAARVRELEAEAARVRELEAKAAREKALAALRKQEEVESMREEARVQQKLQQMGVCSAGYAWIKQPQGYQCAGGSHFISNDQLGI